MAKDFGITQYPVISPLAGLYEMYKDYKTVERQQEQDAYTKEKDARTFGLQEQQLAAQRDYQQRSLDQNDPIALQGHAYKVITDPNSTPGQIGAAQNLYGMLTYKMDPTRTIEKDQQMKAFVDRMFGAKPSLLGLGGDTGVGYPTNADLSALQTMLGGAA
jgi:hypothetical protein